MENIASALKMVAAILVFVIALASAFSIFGTTKQTADSIITMRDKQGYLDIAQMDNGILYTSTNSIVTGNVEGVNTNGDRIVTIDNVVSTIYRYNKEKYGVTILESNGNVIARFDSNTENVMRQWYNIVKDEITGKTAEEQKTEFTNKIKKNISTFYVPEGNIKLDLEEIYEVTTTGNAKIQCGAPWYGNEAEIQKRIACELSGEKYDFHGQWFQRTKGVIDILNDAKAAGKKIVEVTNEIDQSDYLKDGTEETNLLQQYEMPTVEIVYIIQ